MLPSNIHRLNSSKVRDGAKKKCSKGIKFPMLRLMLKLRLPCQKCQSWALNHQKNEAHWVCEKYGDGNLGAASLLMPTLTDFSLWGVTGFEKWYPPPRVAGESVWSGSTDSPTMPILYAQYHNTVQNLFVEYPPKQYTKLGEVCSLFSSFGICF